jgi:acylphosphatase
MLVARRYLVSGRVHAVGFRAYAYDIAVREGLSGWVRNVADGRVEIRAEGEAEAIHRFDLAIRRGPPAARVDAVDTEIEAPSGRHTGFQIRG